jgi:hypothetical protein
MNVYLGSGTKVRVRVMVGVMGMVRVRVNVTLEEGLSKCHMHLPNQQSLMCGLQKVNGLY